MALQPNGYARFGHAFALARQARLAEVLLGQHVDGDLRPRFRHEHVLHLEDGRAVRIDDARGPRRERDARKGILTFGRRAASDMHGGTSCTCTNLLYWSS